MSFTFVVLLFGTGWVLLSLSYLTMEAQMGHGVLKSVTQPLAPIFVSIVRSILSVVPDRKQEFSVRH